MTHQETRPRKRRLDPVVEEVRQIRQAHARRFGYDPEAIFADLKRLQNESTYEVVSFPPRRVKNDGKTPA